MQTPDRVRHTVNEKFMELYNRLLPLTEIPVLQLDKKEERIEMDSLKWAFSRFIRFNHNISSLTSENLRRLLHVQNLIGFTTNEILICKLACNGTNNPKQRGN